MRRLAAAAIAALAAAQAPAQEATDPWSFSETSEAKTWNLYAEIPARFEARVTDALCALTEDCPADCGGGARQLVLLRAADGAMVLPLKNNQPAFTGAVEDLLPWCGQDVEVDGLLLDDPDLGARNVYQVQKIRALGAADWVAANRWTKVWAERYPDATGAGPWFRRDPRILAHIAQEGWLGLGPDTDAAFIAEEYGK